MRFLYKVLSVLFIIFLSTSLAFGQVNDEKFRVKATQIVNDFYEQLNSYSSTNNAEERILFMESILNDFVVHDESLLFNDLYEDGSDYFSSSDYLNTIKSAFPIKGKSLSFEVSNIMCNSPEFISDKGICLVFYDLKMKGTNNEYKDIDKIKTMKATIIFPNNDLHRAFISKTSYSSEKEKQEESEELRKNIMMLQDWEKIEHSENHQDYQSYLNKYPDGKFSKLAKIKMEELEKKDQALIQREAWNEAKINNTIAAYKEFIKVHPYSPYAYDAKDAIEKIRMENEKNIDRKQWERAQLTNTREAYVVYIRNNKLGEYVEEANAKIKELDAESMAHIGYGQTIKGGASNAIYSMLFPGWGQYKVNAQKAPYYIIGVAAYGLAGAGGYLTLKSLSAHKKYEETPNNSEGQSDRDKYKSEYDKYHDPGLYLLAGGAAVWLTDIIWVAIKGAKNKKAYKRLNNEHSFIPTYRIYPDEKTVNFGVIMQL